MATAHLVNVEHYLHSTFEPDAEYVNGKIVERSLPQKPHSKMQTFLARLLYETGHPLGYEVWVEQRIRTVAKPPHYRIPDVCVTFGEPEEDVFVEGPFLCIEVLSVDDSALELRTKVDEYLAMGVQFVWIVDPVSLRGEVHTSERVERITDGVFRADTIAVDVRSVQ